MRRAAGGPCGGACRAQRAAAVLVFASLRCFQPFQRLMSIRSTSSPEETVDLEELRPLLRDRALGGDRRTNLLVQSPHERLGICLFVIHCRSSPRRPLRATAQLGIVAGKASTVTFARFPPGYSEPDHSIALICEKGPPFSLLSLPSLPRGTDPTDPKGQVVAAGSAPGSVVDSVVSVSRGRLHAAHRIPLVAGQGKPVRESVRPLAPLCAAGFFADSPAFAWLTPVSSRLLVDATLRRGAVD